MSIAFEFPLIIYPNVSCYEVRRRQWLSVHVRFFLTGVISVRPLNAWSHTIDCAICERLKTLCQKAMRLLRPITLRDFDNLRLWGH